MCNKRPPYKRYPKHHLGFYKKDKVIISYKTVDFTQALRKYTSRNKNLLNKKTHKQRVKQHCKAIPRLVNFAHGISSENFPKIWTSLTDFAEMKGAFFTAKIRRQFATYKLATVQTFTKIYA
jgi:hypothetical protein